MNTAIQTSAKCGAGRQARPGCVLALLLGGVIALRAAPEGRPSAAYVLRDHLDYDWPRQLIGFDLHFAPGAGREIGALTANGEPVLFQAPAGERTVHADGTLSSARVYVFTSLPAAGSVAFKAYLDAEGPLLAPEDLRVEAEAGAVTLETDAGAGVRLPLGEFTGAGIPAPYQGFKLGRGHWVGGSRLMGQPGPERLSAAVTERGPVFAEVTLRYAYPEGKHYRLRCRVFAGSPVALFTEEFDTEPGARYHRSLREQPLRFRQNRFGFSEDFESSHWVRVDMRGFRPDLEALESYADMPQTDCSVAASDPWLATLHPYQSWHGGTRKFPLFNRDDYLGLMTLNAGRWVRPLENLILVRQDQGEVFLQVPINHGARRWGLHFGSPEAALPSGEGPYPHFLTASALRRARIAWGETSLDVVKDWTLSWPDAVSVPHPVSVFPRGDLEAAHARFRDVPELAEISRQVVAAWRQRFGDRLTAEDLGPPTYAGELGRRPYLNAMASLYLSTGAAEHAHHQFLLLRALLDYYIHQTLDGVGHNGFHWGHDHGMRHISQTAQIAVQMADPLLGSPHIADAQREQLRARLAFLAHLLTDADYYPPTSEIGKGGFARVNNRAMAVGIVGCVLAGHPLAEEWQQVAQARLEEFLSNHIYPDGVVVGGTHYAGCGLDAVIPFLALLKNAGGVNYFEDERFKRGMRWYAQMCPPRDARFGRAYMPPYGYSHPTDTSQSARWAVAAAMTHDSDPEFAALMMDTWERQGRPASMELVAQAGVGMIDPALSPGRPPQRKSESWENFGAVLRAHSDTDRETYMSVCDWGGWANESAGLHLYAKGAPMSLVFGSRAYFNGAAWYSGLTQNRVVFDRREEPRGTRRSGRQTWVSLPVADLFGTQFRFTGLQGRAAVFEGDEEDPGNLELSEPRPWPKGAPRPPFESGPHSVSRFGAIECVPPQDWQRRVLFVKDEDPLGPNYFLIRDSITGTLPTEWNLWVMSEERPRVEGQRAHFQGKYGVDLEVFFAGPPRNIITGAWGPGPGAHRDWGRGFERQRLLQLQRGAGEDYLAVLYPHTADEQLPQFSALGEGRGVRLDWPDRTDHLILGDGAAELQANGLQFAGEAGIAQRGGDWLRLTLLIGDRIGLDDFVLMQGREVVEDVRLSGEGAVSVTATATPDRRLVGEATGGPREVVIHVPAGYAGLAELRIDGQAARLRPEGYGIYAFQMPPGDRVFEIR